MTDHDPLCPVDLRQSSRNDGCQCGPNSLIARVREDEREKAYDSVPALAVYAQEKYEQGQRDERERIRTGVTGLDLDEMVWPDWGGEWGIRAQVFRVIDGNES